MSVRRLRIAEVCCCAGGATYGYQQAGHHVTGVDVVRHPDYCGDDFILCDAVTFINGSHGKFDFYSAHPPCQGYSGPNRGTNKALNHIAGRVYSDLIPPIREALERTGRPWVIENVPGSTVRRDLTLCGEMFGLDVLQERYFEVSGVKIPQPVHPVHRGYVRGWRHGVWRDGPYVAAYGTGGGKATVKEMQDAKKIWWTDDPRALREAIPPAYTEYIAQWL